MSTEEFSNSLYERAFEPADEVVLPRPVIETRGLQPEDLGVLAALILRDPGRPATAKSMAEDLRSLGWKMSVDRFQAVSGRLTKAGHLYRESVFNETTGRPETVTRIYRNPANNPGYIRDGILASGQVGRGIGKNPIGIGKNPVPRGQDGIGENPIADPGSGFPRSRKYPVSPVQDPDRVFPDAEPSPPHPPEEVTTSSPTPHTDTDGSSALPSQTGEGREFSPKEIHAAESFLQRMSKPWNAGRATATKCAPKLLRAMDTQGWPSIFDVDKRVLEHDITKNPGGITRHAQVLPGRIADLSLYDVVAPAPAQTPAARPNEPERGPISTESITSLLDSLQGPSL
ncbi:hypothetical protein ACIG0A_33375 [Streptomyces californicus]|uniref:hypothetical protein n=1 Tax=Streptomyces californicus TaxID=67351 RepID=UPI0037D5F1D2